MILTKTVTGYGMGESGEGQNITHQQKKMTEQALLSSGFIATEMLEHIPEKVLEGIKEKIPMGRLGRPDEIARVVHFLVGDQPSFITGAIWAVNGGMDM